MGRRPFRCYRVIKVRQAPGAQAPSPERLPVVRLRLLTLRPRHRTSPTSSPGSAAACLVRSPSQRTRGPQTSGLPLAREVQGCWPLASSRARLLWSNRSCTPTPAVACQLRSRAGCADPKIRIYDSGMKKYGVDAFPHCVHLVRCGPPASAVAGVARPADAPGCVCGGLTEP
jgi:hypothetical protein